MKLKGTIRRNDLEGGHWTLETDDGDNYQLIGATQGCKDGLKAEVEGKVDRNAMGIGMTGPDFKVESIKTLCRRSCRLVLATTPFAPASDRRRLAKRNRDCSTIS